MFSVGLLWYFHRKLILFQHANKTTTYTLLYKIINEKKTVYDQFTFQHRQHKNIYTYMQITHIGFFPAILKKKSMM